MTFCHVTFVPAKFESFESAVIGLVPHEDEVLMHPLLTMLVCFARKRHCYHAVRIFKCSGSGRCWRGPANFVRIQTAKRLPSFFERNDTQVAVIIKVWQPQQERHHHDVESPFFAPCSCSCHDAQCHGASSASSFFRGKHERAIAAVPAHSNDNRMRHAS